MSGLRHIRNGGKRKEHKKTDNSLQAVKGKRRTVRPCEQKTKKNGNAWLNNGRLNSQETSAL